MSESAYTVHSDNISRACARIPQRIKNCNSCAHEGPGFIGWQFFWDRGESFGAGDHVLGITAVEVDAGDFSIDAHREVTAPALFTNKTMPAMPTDTDALTNCP
jgi:hypothetical protein